MVGKSDVTAAPDVDNVVVYVSNDHLTQSYTVAQQTKDLQTENKKPVQSSSHYGLEILAESTLTPQPAKQFINKEKQYFTSFTKTNTLQKSLTNNMYNSVANKALIYSGNILDSSLKTVNECERQNALPNIHSGMTVGGAEIPQQVTRCDSVRSETAESSCSSLSSADDGFLVVQNQPKLVMYESNIKPNGVALTLEPTSSKGVEPVSSISETVSISHSHNPTIAIPLGWKRILNNGFIHYISPSNTILSTPEQVKEYLLSSGTCKCGLECPLMYEHVFSFDTKIGNKPWTILPDSNAGNLTKLCNHKRKMLPTSLICKSKIKKENIANRKRQRMEIPYSITPTHLGNNEEEISVNLCNRSKNVLKNLSQQPIWQSPLNIQISNNRLTIPECVESSQTVFSHPNESNFDQLTDTPVIINDDGSFIVQGSNILTQQIPRTSVSNLNVQLHLQQPINPNNQIINIQGTPNQNNLFARQIQNENISIQNQDIQKTYSSFDLEPEQRLLLGNLPLESTGPGRPNIPLVSNSNIESIIEIQNQKLNSEKVIGFNNHPQYHVNNQNYQNKLEVNKHLRTFDSNITSNIRLNAFNQIPEYQKFRWQNSNKHSLFVQNQILPVHHDKTCERVPPLHQLTSTPINWNDEIQKKKMKLTKVIKHNRTYQIIDGCRNNYSNVDVGQIHNIEQGNKINHQNSSSPSFMEDPSGYLAQQTALLNSTINRQTGGHDNFSFTNNYATSINQQERFNITSNHNLNETAVIENVMTSKTMNNANQNGTDKITSKFKSAIQCSGSNPLDRIEYRSCGECHIENIQNYNQKVKYRRNSQSDTPHSLGSEDAVTSSATIDKNNLSTDLRPIQGGTVSTSNISPVDSNSGSSNPPTPIPHTPTPPITKGISNSSPISWRSDISKDNYFQSSKKDITNPMLSLNFSKSTHYGCPIVASVVTTMASSRTVGSNTITSVLAGRGNTVTVSVSSPASHSNSSNAVPTLNLPSHTAAINTSKTPLEMVQSVVTNLQVPQSAHSDYSSFPNQMIKQSLNLPISHIVISSTSPNLITNTGNSPINTLVSYSSKLMTNTQNSISSHPVSQIVTNVTASMTQVIPAVTQQVLGQQTVVLNTLSTPFMFHSGVTMAMDGLTVGTNMQMPQLVSGNVVQQQVQINNIDGKREQPIIHEMKKKSKKRKMIQTVANVLQLGPTQQNSGHMIAMPQQGFPQQTLQMAHSPQGVGSTPVMQTLTIVPSKSGTSSQILFNGQTMTNNASQQMINSPSTQQINLLQPVNFINGGGVVQNFPIQQFIVPNLGGVIMNPDGTATIIQDTSNIGMQIQLQNVNGQNVLTSVQNNSLFNGNQNILATGPAGMIIRTPSQGKIVQQHSPGAQFLSPNGNHFVVNGNQLSGQLSPLVASVSPSKQIAFGTSSQILKSSNHEFIPCGQTLMVPCSLSAAPNSNISVSSGNLNANFMQHNATIVQQQTSMVSNNQQLANIQNSQTTSYSDGFKVNDNCAIDMNDKIQGLAVYRENFRNSSGYKQSVSTQTAVNQNARSITTNTFCQTSISTSSPPDTTTLSPVASEPYQRSTSADTTTHSLIDERLSPGSASSTTNDNILKSQQSYKMAMVNCISSSKPDLLDINSQSDVDWRMQQQVVTKSDYIEELQPSKVINQIVYPDSSPLKLGHHLVDTKNNLCKNVSTKELEKNITHVNDNNLITNCNRYSSKNFIYDIDKG